VLILAAVRRPNAAGKTDPDGDRCCSSLSVARFSSLALVPLALAVSGASAQAPVINEVYYDPEGADAGQEFVELYNAGPQPVSLSGVRLEFANGADGPVWQTRWEATAADTIASAGFFLIADRGWAADPPPQAEVTLGLQNGPDAVRLVRDGTALDRVGYGDLQDAELYESQPAVDVASGQSLARRPDGQDTDANAVDLVAAEPTPGRMNFAVHAVSLVAVSCEPPSATLPGRDVILQFVLVGAGLESVGPVAARLAVGSAVTVVELPLIEPGVEGYVTASFRPGSGGQSSLGLVIPLPTVADSLQLDLGTYYVGSAALRIAEVMAAPTAGGEWIELVADAARPVVLAGYRLRDADGAWRTLPPLLLAPGERAVLVQDRVLFQTYWEQTWQAAGVQPCIVGNDWDRIVELSGWPTLNNSAPADRSYADRVILADTVGIIDHVDIGPGSAAGQGEVVPGRSLERLAPVAQGRESANWALCAVSVGGTPGCPNSVSLPGPTVGDLSLAPNPFRPAGGGEVLHIRFHLAAGNTAWDARIYDLWGRAVRDLGGDALGPGPRALIWDGLGDDGRPLPPGGYIVLVRWQDAGGNLTGGTKRLVALLEADRP